MITISPPTSATRRSVAVVMSVVNVVPLLSAWIPMLNWRSTAPFHRRRAEGGSRRTSCTNLEMQVSGSTYRENS